MNQIIVNEDLKFDQEQYKDVLELVENYAVGSILIGKNVICKIYPTTLDDCSELRYRCNNNGNYTNLNIKFTRINSSKTIFNISFRDAKFDPSGFKGFFNREKYKYRLRRAKDYFEYEIDIDFEYHTEQIARLLKLFRKYL